MRPAPELNDVRANGNTLEGVAAKMAAGPINRVFDHLRMVLWGFTMLRLSRLALALLLTCAAGRAQAGDLALRDAVSMTGTALFLSSGAPGLIIGVVRGKESVIQAYGETAPGSGREPDGKSIFRIASVSKVFAADVLASMAANGRVRLADPLFRYAPGGRNIKSAGQPITLLDLVTHSAGLPRELPDPSVKVPPGGNPFSVFRSSYYWDWLSREAPAYPPGKRAIYSNMGFSLLGDALATAAGKPYGALLDETVLQPLGLKDTTLRLSEEQLRRQMVGIDTTGKPDPNVDVPSTMAASGGLYSTGDDMLAWIRWHLSEDSTGASARALAHAMWRPHDGLRSAVGVEVTQSAGMGLGWVWTPVEGSIPALLGKSGGIGGFMTYVVISPNRDLGIFVVASRVSFSMFEGLRQGVRQLAAELAGPTP